MIGKRKVLFASPCRGPHSRPSWYDRCQEFGKACRGEIAQYVGSNGNTKELDGGRVKEKNDRAKANCGESHKPRIEAVEEVLAAALLSNWCNDI